MCDELVFYTHPLSRGRIVRWMLEEIGQPYHTELLEYGPAMQSAEFLAINPMGKVPAIRHGEMVVTETPAICAYLADAFPQAALAPPPEDRRRGSYYRWLFFAAGPFESAMMSQVMGVVEPEVREKMVGYGPLGAVLDALEEVLAEGDYLVGEHFTAADIYLGSQIGRSMAMGWLEKRPVLEEYWKRVNARPAALRAKQIDDALASSCQGTMRSDGSV
jgi:glutathione S-transferase